MVWTHLRRQKLIERSNNLLVRFILNWLGLQPFCVPIQNDKGLPIFVSRLSVIIDEALKKQLSNSNDINAPFIDIEDYKKKTGKRFRMTKAQREAGLTREQAFQEFMENMVERG